MVCDNSSLTCCLRLAKYSRTALPCDFLLYDLTKSIGRFKVAVPLLMARPRGLVTKRHTPGNLGSQSDRSTAEPSSAMTAAPPNAASFFV